MINSEKNCIFHLKVFFFCVIAIIYVNADEAEQIPILRQESDIFPDGTYNYAYETGNGIAASEQGVPKRVEENEPIIATGEYSYTSPEGQLIKVSYIADENGFQPSSDILPTTPEVPIAIQRYYHVHFKVSSY